MYVYVPELMTEVLRMLASSSSRARVLPGQDNRAGNHKQTFMTSTRQQPVWMRHTKSTTDALLKKLDNWLDLPSAIFKL